MIGKLWVFLDVFVINRMELSYCIFKYLVDNLDGDVLIFFVVFLEKDDWCDL